MEEAGGRQIGEIMAKGKHSGKEQKNKTIKIKSKTKLLRAFLILLLIISVSILIIKLSHNDTDPLIEEIQKDNSAPQKGVETERIKKLKELQKENSDIVGWIEIENSKINYPVLQTTDNDFYVRHNYKKEYSFDGSIFLDKDYNWNLPSTNLLIYGHNNKGSSEMFVDLMKYKDEEYYNTHNTIRFTTSTEDAEYEIIAVFLSRIFYKSETDVFRYYYFINANNEEEFNDYIENCKKISLYNIEATAKYGDQLMTLITCSYHTEDGRLAVVARKIER